MPPDILQRTTVYRGYMTVETLRLRMDDGTEVVREVEHHGDAVAVLPFDPLRRTALLVRLFRAPAFATSGEEALEEACAGMLARDEAGDEGGALGAVRREALEELGLRLGDVELIARVWPSPGVSTERVSLFLAPYDAADRVGEGGGVASEHEAITVIERPLADLAADADVGLIEDAKLLTLVLALRARQPELFEP
jgi:nudix-type nucleoside diphosphatase (YffH/AdpP family)